MPLYCFTSEEGETIEEFFPMGKVPEYLEIGCRGECKVFLDSPEKFVRYTRDRQAEWREGPASGSKGEWPIECYAVGVHASQAQELRDYFKSHGCPTEVTKDGDPVFRDHQHMKRALKCRGQHHNNSYGN